MQKSIAALPLIALLALPLAASAHEHQVFEINGIKYELSIGSANEPVYVGDKTGLQLSVSKVGVVSGHEGHHDHASGEGAVEGLEKTLKVEMIMGNAKKEFALAPTYAAPGAYNTVFYPTKAEPFSYRIFGTIDEIPVDILFTCKAAHDMEGAAADTSRVDIAPGVVRVEQRGAFGCPMDKASIGFPGDASQNSNSTGSTALALSAASLALSIAALAIARRKQAY